MAKRGNQNPCIEEKNRQHNDQKSRKKTDNTMTKRGNQNPCIEEKNRQHNDQK